MVVVTDSSWLSQNLSKQYTEKSLGPELQANIGCICSIVPKIMRSSRIISILHVPHRGHYNFLRVWGLNKTKTFNETFKA